jgi:hypothetical protein
MPTLIAQDNFDSYANTAQLDAQAGWAVSNGIVNIHNPTSSAGSVFASSQGMARSTATFSADQRSECTCAALVPGSFTFVNVGVRCQVGADTRYWFQTDGTNWYLVVRVAGAQTVITNSTHSITSGAKIALEVTGAGSAARLTAQVDTGGGWTNVTGAVSIDPASYIDGGTPGIGGDSGSATCRGDDWKGYDLTVGRTTKNTRAFPLGMNVGMGFGIGGL